MERNTLTEPVKLECNLVVISKTDDKSNIVISFVNAQESQGGGNSESKD